jgi:hypothetical protein
MDPKNLDYEEDDMTTQIGQSEQDKVSSKLLNRMYLKDNHNEKYDHSQFNLYSEEEKLRQREEK